MGEWKLVFDRPVPLKKGQITQNQESMKPELYKLSGDISEQNNLAAAHLERVEVMLARARHEDIKVRQ